MQNTILLNDLVYENEFTSFFEGEQMLEKEQLEDQIRKMLERLDYIQGKYLIYASDI
jgi:hypothetical protein